MELVETSGNPRPEGLEGGTVKTRDNLRLRYATCGIHDKPNRGTVCLFQGRGEFIEKYYETIARLRERDFAVATLDWRGQGGSERLLNNPRKGHIRRFAQYDEDLATFVREVVLPDCPPPYYALAHSMGGNIVLRALATRTWFSKVVTVAPLIGLAPHGAPWKLVRAVTALAVMIGLGRLYVPGHGNRLPRAKDFKDNPLTSDERRFLRTAAVLESASYLGIGGPTIGWVNAALAATARLRHMATQTPFRTPVLIVTPGDDRVVSPEAIAAFAHGLSILPAVTVDKARHELLMERDLFQSQFWAAFDSFVHEHRDALRASAA